MTDSLISFTTAQLAKLKGFDELCEWRYDEDGNLTVTKIVGEKESGLDFSLLIITRLFLS